MERAMTNREKLIEYILKLNDEDAGRVLRHLREEKEQEQSVRKELPTKRRIVYSIKNNVTGKEYIGITGNLESRVKAHMSALRCGKHTVEDMQSDYDKYGEVFTVSELCESNDFPHNTREYELIESRGTYIREKGYNYNDTTFRRWKASREKEKR